MTRNGYDDRSLSVLFTIIGVLGILPALYGLYTAGLISFAFLEALTRGDTQNIGVLPVSMGFIAVTLFGFWLLLQYVRRARGNRASVSQRSLWQLTTVQNTIYLLASLAIFSLQPVSGGAIFMGVVVGWFTLLVIVATHAAGQSPAEETA